MESINAASLRRKSGQWGTQPSLTVKQFKKVTDSQDDDFGSFDEKHPKQFSAYGPTPHRFRPRYALARGTRPIPSELAMTQTPRDSIWRG